MRLVSVLGIIAIAVMLIPTCPLVPAAPPASLPDLSVTSDDIEFLEFGSPVYYSYETEKYTAFTGDYITINVTIHNNGAVSSPPGNVTFYDNERFMATVPTTGWIPASGAENFSFAQYIWDTNLATVGNHTIRVNVAGPDGDSNPENNIAQEDIGIIGPYPVVGLSIDEPSPIATVTPTSEGIVNLTGHAYIDKGEEQVVDISLYANVDVGWKTILNPDKIRFISERQENFSVEVHVPAATSNLIYAKLTVEAIINIDGVVDTPKTQAMISVAPYFRLAVVPNAVTSEIAPAQSADFSVAIRNTGNAVDSYRLRIENRAELERNGWNFTTSQEIVAAVHPDETRTVKIMAHAPVDWAPWKSETTIIRLNVSSVNAPYHAPGINVSQTVSLKVHQSGFFMPGVAIILALPLVALAAAGVFWYVWRGRKKPKTVADYDKELNI
jgi:hypothetical protein